jgi:hypothetical protein
MTTLVRIQFRKMPNPNTIAAILAAAVFDESYEDSDIIQEES